MSELTKLLLEISDRDCQLGDVVVEFSYTSTGPWSSVHTRWTRPITKIDSRHVEVAGVYFHDFHAKRSDHKWRVIRGCQEVMDIWLRAGDIILSHSATSKTDRGVWWSLISSELCVIDHVTDCGDVVLTTGQVIHEIKQDIDVWFTVKRPDHGACAVATPPTKKSSDWNGVCPRCGKGTYQGLFELKHDGDCR